MLITLKDYILCYSPAFTLGVATGLLIAQLISTKQFNQKEQYNENI